MKIPKKLVVLIVGVLVLVGAYFGVVIDQPTQDQAVENICVLAECE